MPSVEKAPCSSYPHASLGIDEAILKDTATSVGTTLEELNKKSDPVADAIKAVEAKRKAAEAKRGSLGEGGI